MRAQILVIILGRVAAGALAERWLAATHGIRILAWVSRVGELEADLRRTLARARLLPGASA